MEAKRRFSRGRPQCGGKWGCTNYGVRFIAGETSTSGRYVCPECYARIMAKEAKK